MSGSVPQLGDLTTSEKEAIIEKVARAICVSDGRDPDSKEWPVHPDRVIDGGDIVTNRDGSVSDLVPLWTNYHKMARRMIAAYAVMSR